MGERRKKKRHDLVCKVQYSTDENPKEIKSVKSFNISLNGIGLRVAKFIEGDKVNLKIFNPREDSPIEVKGKVVWQSHFMEQGVKMAGVRFLKTPWSEEEKKSNLSFA